MPLMSRPIVARLIAVLALAGLAGAAAAQARFALEGTETILAKSALPERMQVRFDLDPDMATFSGSATLHLQVRQRSGSIELHASRLDAGEIVLRQGAQRRPMRVEPDTERQTWRLVPADGQPIAPGRHRLQLEWRGQVQGVGEGLFRVEHRLGREATAGSARMLATQLQAIQARALLPLMDEPVFRTVFEVEVRAPAGYEVLSNMPRLARRVQGPHALHRFAPTPPMPSYLLAVAVGRFDHVESRATNRARTLLRIFTPPGRADEAAFALRSTEQLLPWLENYFGVPYALPKLDQLAVAGVRGGAMEDWGLISYVESGLLVNPASSRPEAPREVFELMAHEIAHQWFGNLVSPASWGELWLNEAFATWMATKALGTIHPEWKPELGTRRRRENAMARDAGAATRPIRSGPVAELAVDSVFDSITYEKGGAVLGMIEAWLGEEAFRQGLGAYMRERRMKPATAGDLWHHMGRVTRQPVAAMAASWTDQPGFPLVSVSTRCEQGQLQITLTQTRFDAGVAQPGGPWQVPVVAARGNERRTWMLSGPNLQVAWPGCEGPPIRLNAGGQGFYRVAYEAAHAQALAASFGALPGTDQLALVSDSHALARSGRQPMAQHLLWLQAALGTEGEARGLLVQQAVSQLDRLLVDLHGTPAAAALRNTALRLLAPLAASLGWDPAAQESAELQAARASLVELLARLGHEATLAGAEQRFAAALAGSAEVSPGMRAAVLQAAQQRGGDAAARRQESALRAMQNTASDEQRWMIFAAVAAAADEPMALRALDASLRGELPTLQATELPGTVAARPELVPTVYAHLLQHWDAWSRLTGVGTQGPQVWLLPTAASASADPTMAARLRADQHARLGVAGADAAARVVQRLEVRQRLRAREGEALAQALEHAAVGARP
jgi:aminopeptidase N